MITAISRITLYVENQKEAEDFWVHKIGFKIVEDQPMGEYRWLEVAPPQGETRFVLYEKEWMKKQNPKADIHHPSLILTTKHMDETHQTLKERGVDIREVMQFPYGRMCTFHDQDGNIFMMREDKK